MEQMSSALGCDRDVTVPAFNGASAYGGNTPGRTPGVVSPSLWLGDEQEHSGLERGLTPQVLVALIPRSTSPPRARTNRSMLGNVERSSAASSGR